MSFNLRLLQIQCLLMARQTYVPGDKYSSSSSVIDLMVNTIKTGRDTTVPQFMPFTWFSSPYKEKVASLIKKTLQGLSHNKHVWVPSKKTLQGSLYPAKVPTSSSLTAMSSEPSFSLQRVLHSVILFGLDTLETGDFWLLGTFFWGSQALSYHLQRQMICE